MKHSVAASFVALMTFAFAVPLVSLAAGIQGPLKKFPFHQDGHYSRETTSTVMGMTNKQSGDVCFSQSTADYSGHIPDATKCTTEVVKDTAAEGTWRAKCTLESGDNVKIESTITHVDSNTVRATFDIDAPQGVKVKGQHLFKFLNAKCPPKADSKTASGGDPATAGGPSDCAKYKNAMATCQSIPANYRKQCEDAIKKSALGGLKNCK